MPFQFDLVFLTSTTIQQLPTTIELIIIAGVPSLPRLTGVSWKSVRSPAYFYYCIITNMGEFECVNNKYVSVNFGVKCQRRGEAPSRGRVWDSGGPLPKIGIFFQ